MIRFGRCALGIHGIVEDVGVSGADNPGVYHIVRVDPIALHDVICRPRGRHHSVILGGGCVHLQRRGDTGPAGGGGRGGSPRGPVAQARVLAVLESAARGDCPHPAVSARRHVLEGAAGDADPPSCHEPLGVVIVDPPPQPPHRPRRLLEGVRAHSSDIDLAEGRVASIPGRSLELRGRHLADVGAVVRARNIIPKAFRYGVQKYFPAVFVSARIAWVARVPIAVCEGAPVRPHKGSFNRQVAEANFSTCRAR
mmetsp:Transcript_66396/g.210123  ORF Transcript_66396/g.210123 Transcript_66396/m.210123 type:complete len:253 (+) Transcript_66396:957-1715(+)